MPKSVVKQKAMSSDFTCADGGAQSDVLADSTGMYFKNNRLFSVRQTIAVKVAVLANVTCMPTVVLTRTVFVSPARFFLLLC